MELQIGMLVESRAGHDRGELYVITNMDAQFVYVCDGRRRTLANPKRKKRRHVAKKGNIPEVLMQKQTAGVPVDNADIKRVIKVWRAKNVEG